MGGNWCLDMNGWKEWVRIAGWLLFYTHKYSPVEEHRRRVSAQYTRLKEDAPQTPPSPAAPPSPSPAPPFIEGMGEEDKRSYEDLMKRLDQLEIEEMG